MFLSVFMRKVVSFSLPEDQFNVVQARVKKRNFPSVSAYMQHLIDLDEDDGLPWILDDELLHDIKRGRKEHVAGKSIAADSLADLL